MGKKGKIASYFKRQRMFRRSPEQHVPLLELEQLQEDQLVL
jgi:hypothetical protein